MESALASAEPVAWYAPSIDDTCTAAKKAQRERDLPETARLFTVPLYTHAQPAVPVASVPEGWYVKRDESEIRIGAPDGIPGCMTLTAKERSLPGRILYALALALTTPEPPHAD